MGKKSRAKMGSPMRKAEPTEHQEEEKKEEKRIFTKTRAWMRKSRMAFSKPAEEDRQKQTDNTRAEFMAGWMKEAGITDWSEMDFSKYPQIHLEWVLCDPVILRGLQLPNGREELFKLLTDEEKDIYLNYRWNGGNTYAEDLEGRRGMSKRTIAKEVYKIKKTKKMMKTM